MGNKGVQLEEATNSDQLAGPPDQVPDLRAPISPPSVRIPKPTGPTPYRRPPPGADGDSRDERFRKPKRKKKPTSVNPVVNVSQSDEWMETFGPVYDATFGTAETLEDHARNKKFLIAIIRELATSEDSTVSILLKAAKGGLGSEKNLRRAFATAHLAVLRQNGARPGTDTESVMARIGEQDEFWSRFQGLMEKLGEGNKKV